MPFELIRKKNCHGFDIPVIAVCKVGIVRFSIKARKTFGFDTRKKVRVFYNKKRHILGFELLSCENDINAFSIDSHFRMSLKSFFNKNGNKLKPGVYELYKEQPTDALVWADLNENLNDTKV